MPGAVPSMRAARKSALPWEHAIHEHAHADQQRQGRTPCGWLPPYRPDGRGLREPAQARCNRARLCLRRLAYRRIRTLCWPHWGR
jgi:hypothetical protein